VCTATGPVVPLPLRLLLLLPRLLLLFVPLLLLLLPPLRLLLFVPLLLLLLPRLLLLLLPRLLLLLVVSLLLLLLLLLCWQVIPLPLLLLPLLPLLVVRLPLLLLPRLLLLAVPLLLVVLLLPRLLLPQVVPLPLLLLVVVPLLLVPLLLLESLLLPLCRRRHAPVSVAVPRRRAPPRLARRWRVRPSRRRRRHDPSSCASARPAASTTTTTVALSTAPALPAAPAALPSAPAAPALGWRVRPRAAVVLGRGVLVRARRLVVRAAGGGAVLPPARALLAVGRVVPAERGAHGRGEQRRVLVGHKDLERRRAHGRRGVRARERCGRAVGGRGHAAHGRVSVHACVSHARVCMGLLPGSAPAGLLLRAHAM
jgi:hypothetical protein